MTLSATTKTLLVLAVLILLPAIAAGQPGGGAYTLIQSSPQPLPACTPATQGQLQPQIWDVTAQTMKTCTAVNTWSAMGGSGTAYYQTIQSSGAALTQRPILDFIPGSNMTINCADNAGATRTECTFIASSTAALAFSSLTASTNSNAGSFIATGNAWNFAGATSFTLPSVGFILPGSTSGTTTFVPPATGTYTQNIPAASGTHAVAATSPITLSATGNIGCATCNVTNATVSSIGLTQTGTVFTFTNNPVTTSGFVNIAFASQAANFVLASPNGAAGPLSPRALVNTDIPQINLAVSGNGGVTGILPKANHPATTVFTDQANTYGAFAQNFGAGSLILPNSAGYAPTLSGSVGYDTTNNRYVVGISGTSFVLPWVPSGTPVNAQCAIWNGTGGALSSGACGGGGSGTVNAAVQYSFPYYSAAGSSTQISGVAPPTTNGVWYQVYNVTGGAAVQPQNTLGGVPVNAQSGNYGLLYSDRAAYVKMSGGTTATLTLPQVTGNTSFNFPFITQNLNSGNLSLTANAADKIDNSATGGTTTVLPKFASFVYQDSSAAPGNWWTVVFPTYAAFGSSCGDGTHALNWSTSTGIGCQTLTTATTVPLSGLTNATGGNTIAANGDFNQIWKWSLTTNSGNALAITESAASSATSSSLLNVATLAASTASPVTFTSRGTTNGWQMVPATGDWTPLGTASLRIPGTAHGVIITEGTTTNVVAVNSTTATNALFATAASDPAFRNIGTQDTSQFWYAAGGGTAQAQTVTLSPAATSLVAGLEVHWKPVAANSGAGPTLAVNGLTATTITKCGTTALAANDLTTSAVAIAIYDGTQFQLRNPMAAACGAGSGDMIKNAANTMGASGTIDLSSASTTGGFTLPKVGGAVPTADGVVAENTTNHTLVFGSNGTTLVAAVAATGTGTATTCTNQFVSAVSSTAVPTCTTATLAGAQFANQGTTTTVLHGNAAGNPSFASVSGPDLAVVQTRRTCDIVIGDQSGSAILNAQLGPQKRLCFIPSAGTLVEMDVAADGGTPNIIVGRNRAGSVSNIVSSALATAAAGGIACSSAAGGTGLDGTTSCSATLQNTSLNAGDYLEAVSGTAGGVAKIMTVHVTYTVN